MLRSSPSSWAAPASAGRVAYKGQGVYLGGLNDKGQKSGPGKVRAQLQQSRLARG